MEYEGIDSLLPLEAVRGIAALTLEFAALFGLNYLYCMNHLWVIKYNFNNVKGDSYVINSSID